MGVKKIIKKVKNKLGVKKNWGKIEFLLINKRILFIISNRKIADKVGGF